MNRESECSEPGDQRRITDSLADEDLNLDMGSPNIRIVSKYLKKDHPASLTINAVSVGASLISITISWIGWLIPESLRISIDSGGAEKEDCTSRFDIEKITTGESSINSWVDT